MAVESWAGGEIRVNRRGERIYEIRAQRGGVRYVITLGALTERQALAELALFERDPSAYRTAREVAASTSAQAVRLSAEVIAQFLAHLADDSRGEARSVGYRTNAKHSLAWWAERGRIGGRDLRGVGLRELTKMLEGAAGVKHKIIHLKSFCGWLRATGDLAPQQDPTLALEVPASRPEKAQRTKRHSAAEVERAYRMIEDQSIRDAIRVRAMTGMHYSELRRLAAGIKSDINELPGHGEIAGTVSFRHKSGRTHVVSLDAPTLAAVKRLRARGGAPSDSWMGKVLRRAAEVNGVEPLELGALRHSFASWRTSARVVKPAEGGASLAQVAAVMGHLNPRTTAIFYDGTEVPEMVLPPLRLEHPDDPVLMGAEMARGGG